MFDAIFVMNLLAAEQRSAQVLSHDETMLAHVLPRNIDVAIAIFANVPCLGGPTFSTFA